MKWLFFPALIILTLVFLPRLITGGKRAVVEPILVTPQEAKSLIREKKVFLLDVHTPEQVHIPGTDAFVPYDQIETNQAKLPPDKNTPILVYCRSGSMSKIAGEKLAKLGYQMVYDLGGGINAYREVAAGVEMSPPAQDLGQVVYGEVAKTAFTLTNFTPAPLTITRVSTSCGCTKAAAKNMKLDPYASTEIDVTFDPAVHQDDTDLGELTRTIYIETDNLNFPKVTAEIKAIVIKK
ncbi:MAG: DUF1573 domain-containing protein [Patescibacteria group bacterium]